jgi:tight adherence protein C
MTLPLIVFGAVFLLLATGGLLMFYRDAVLGRLASVIPSSSPVGGLGRLRQFRAKTSVSEVVKSFEKVLPRSVAEVSVVQKRLIRAGYRQAGALPLFYGFKVLSPLALMAVATVTGAYQYGAFFV